MRGQTITSRENPAVKQYTALASSRRRRREDGRFTTEGVKLTLEAFTAGYTPEALFLTQDLPDSVRRLLMPAAAACRRLYEISPSVAAKLAGAVSPQGVFGVFMMLDNRTQPVKIGSNGKYLLLSSLQDPGNVGTILRTAAAFGTDGVILSADCPDLYAPKVLRASMGGVFRARACVSDDLSASIAALRAAGVPVWAAMPAEGSVSLRDISLHGGGAVVVGNEGGGIAPELAALCDGALTIPMEPGCESLNAAMAAGVILWEMYR